MFTLPYLSAPSYLHKMGIYFHRSRIIYLELETTKKIVLGMQIKLSKPLSPEKKQILSAIDNITTIGASIIIVKSLAQLKRESGIRS